MKLNLVKVFNFNNSILLAKPIWTKEPKNVTSILHKDVILECDAKSFPQPHIDWIKLSSNSMLPKLIN